MQHSLTPREGWRIPRIFKRARCPPCPIGANVDFSVSHEVSSVRSVRYVVARGNALLQSLFAGPMVLIKDPLHNRPKVVEPFKVAQELLQVCVLRSIFP